MDMKDAKPLLDKTPPDMREHARALVELFLKVPEDKRRSMAHIMLGMGIGFIAGVSGISNQESEALIAFICERLGIIGKKPTCEKPS
jgi:hypothetical protein